MENQDLIALIDQIKHPIDIDQQKMIREQLMNWSKELRGRVNPDLQISASAVVFKDTSIFFIKHPYLKTWLLPAGHVELGETPLETAQREFFEETGLTVKGGQIIDVNVIEIPANPIKEQGAHQHVDFRFLFELTDEVAHTAELPVRLMTKDEVTAEFKPYFSM
ncbi:NUDIX domain-containing protein [Weissella muntiaci]|uniref:NUDIX domain-containing protein n=1 Tax=Weissella muntiaci TaxID=2508881 RepID=A0A6C2C883_9LACO|nr:NUDIX domain-containing protein [Weissella muntiaci]TYC50144.1 NUDIX domain-containing protein [Weissella muntiaci]